MECRIFKTSEKFSDHKKYHKIIEVGRISELFEFPQKYDIDFDCKFIISFGDTCCYLRDKKDFADAMFTIEIVDELREGI